MKFKKAAVWFAALSLCVGALAAPATAAEAGRQSTETEVTFTTDPNETNLLRLLEVPTMDFGSNEISMGDEEYDAVTASSTFKLEVVDQRGTGTGWKVTASFAKPLAVRDVNGDAEEKDYLKGARIMIGDGEVSYYRDQAVKPVAPQHQANQSDDKWIVLENNVNMPAAVLTAAIDAGEGQWIDTLKTVTLKVPGGVARAETYTGTLLWLLSDTPND